MTSFSLPGRGVSILNDATAESSRAGSSSSTGAADGSAAWSRSGSPRREARSTAAKRKAIDQGRIDAGNATRAWRKTTAAAAGIGLGAADPNEASASNSNSAAHSTDASEAPSPNPSPPGTASGGGSSDESPGSSGGSYFATKDGGYGSGMLSSSISGTARSYSTEATSLGDGSWASERSRKMEPSKLGVPADTRRMGGASPTAPRDSKVLSEPGLVTSPQPMDKDSPDADDEISPPSGTHNGPGGHGSRTGIDGHESGEPERTRRLASMRQGSSTSGMDWEDQLPQPQRSHGDFVAPMPPRQNSKHLTVPGTASRSSDDSSGPSPMSTSQDSSRSPSMAVTNDGSTSSASHTPSQPLTVGGKKRYPCPFPGCEKTFSTSGHAARHHRIHSGRKPYRCTFPGCKASFSRQDNSLQHYRTHVLHPKGRSAAAVAGSIDASSDDLGSLHLDPETEASVQLGRKALQEGTAIAVVQEVVGRDGRKEEAVARTVGMPRLRRESMQSDADMRELEELRMRHGSNAPHVMIRSASGGPGTMSVHHTPPRMPYAEHGHLPSSSPHHMSHGHLVHHAAPPHVAAFAPPPPPHAVNIVARPVLVSAAPPLPPHGSPTAYSGHRSWSSDVAPHSSMAAYGAPPHPAESRRMSSTSATSSEPRWADSPLNLMPSFRREVAPLPHPAGAYGDHRRSHSMSNPRPKFGNGGFDGPPRGAAHADIAASVSPPMSHMDRGTPFQVPPPPRAGPSGSSAISRLPPPSALPHPSPAGAPMPPTFASPSAAAKLGAGPHRSTMRLTGPLPSLMQLPCSSDRSTSGMTPTTPMDSPGLHVGINAAAPRVHPPTARQELMRLPPLRPRGPFEGP